MAAKPAPKPTGGQTQSWAVGAKDVVATSLTARVWATVGQGIVTEVFWPAVDQPQVKDFGFLVVKGTQWREVRAVGDYVVEPHDDPAVPLARVTHAGDFYNLTLQVVPDPDRDALLVSYDLSADPDVLLYPLLAPHLGTYSAGVGDTGTTNYAWTENGALLASDGGERVLCLQGDFSRTSVGYVGYSDGWTDLNSHLAMTWTYDAAGPGVVALMGELRQFTGTLALGFGTDSGAAQATASAALAAGVDSARTKLTQQWQQRAATLAFPSQADGLAADVVAAVRHSSTVLRSCEDRTTEGGIVAGLATPWGESTNDPGGYHMVWCRDGSESALALAALGDLDSGCRLLSFLSRQQRADGSWGRCYFLDGSALDGLQLDETAFPVLLAAKLAELGATLPAGTDNLIRRAVTYLVQNGPLHSPESVDRWEETAGGSPFTLALIVVALVAGAQYFSGDDRDYLLRLADDWNSRLEDYTYVAGGIVDRAYGTDGHYVRLGPANDQVRIGNQLPPGVTLRAEMMVGLEFLYLPRLGLRDPADKRITDSVVVADHMLARQTASGVAYSRYDLDGYGEWLDGSGWPVRGFGIGRPWPLLAGERGHYEALRGCDATATLSAMLAMRGRGGLLPEQVWDVGDLPWRGLRNGQPTGSAMPLAWAHSELIKLAVTVSTGNGRPVERLAVVEHRYGGTVPTSTLLHWRPSAPVTSVPTGHSLIVEDAVPFTLHYGFDGWQQSTVSEQATESRPFGMYAVALTPDDLGDNSSLQFTRRFDGERWEGRNYDIELNQHPPAVRSLRLPARETAGRQPFLPNANL